MEASAQEKGILNPEKTPLQGLSVLEQIHSLFGSFLEASEKFDITPLGEIRLLRAEEEKKELSPQPQEKLRPSQSISKEVGFTFQDYLNVIKKLKIFHNTNDKEAYQEWMERRGNEGARLFIALRRWEKSRGAKAIHSPGSASSLALESKYVELAQNENNIQPLQVKKLHQYIKCFDEMRLVLRRFSQIVRSQPKEILQGIQMIWPDFKVILDGEWSTELMLSRLEVPLVKIGEPRVGKRIESLLEALCKKAEAISRKHSF